jgi:sulfur-oxidizing protein SoxY
VTTMNRRTFLKGTMAASAVAVAAGAGLLKPAHVLAAEWPKKAFDQDKLEEALNALYGSSSTSDSKAIKIKAPLQAENGAVVPIEVSTSMGNIESVSIYVAKNPRPLVANLNTSGASGYFSARMKMGKTSDVHAVVKSGGKLYSSK